MRDRTELALPNDDLHIILQILANRIPDRPVWAFGSRTNGKAQRRSDLDLAIGGPTPLTLRQRALLNDDFDESDLPIEVDFLDLNAISPEFKQRIERDFIPLYDGAAKRLEEVIA